MVELVEMMIAEGWDAVKTKKIKFLVVLDLPVPVHVHHDRTGTISFCGGIDKVLHLLPEKYQKHPYHSSDVCVLPDLSMLNLS